MQQKGVDVFNSEGKEVVVSCPETVGVEATLNPVKPGITSDIPDDGESHKPGVEPESATVEQPAIEKEVIATSKPTVEELKEQHYTITYDSIGYSYETIMVPYLAGAKSVVIEDPYIRATHQVQNFIRFCEAVLKQPTVKKIKLITSYDDHTNVQEMAGRLKDVQLDIEVNENLHDREIRIDNGWTVKIGRGLDFFQKPDSWFSVGSNDLSLRKCLETKVDIYQTNT